MKRLLVDFWFGALLWAGVVLFFVVLATPLDHYTVLRLSVWACVAVEVGVIIALLLFGSYLDSLPPWGCPWLWSTSVIGFWLALLTLGFTAINRNFPGLPLRIWAGTSLLVVVVETAVTLIPRYNTLR